MRRLLSIVLILSLVFATNSFSAAFQVKVINAQDGTAISGATVTINETGKQLTTDLNGKMIIKNDQSELTLSISHVGFTQIDNYSITPGQEIVIALTPSVTELNPIVITAHRAQEEAFKVSQSVTVFDSENIENQGHTTVTSVIERAPGVDVNDAGPFRARPVIRGMYGSRTLVLVDGERLNDHREVVDFAGVSMSLVDVNEIERVEVLNGPSSVLYGSDAMGGVINIITKSRRFADELSPYISYNSRFSTADELSSNRVDFGVGAEKFGFSAGFLYKEAKKDYAPPDNWQSTDPRYNVFRPEFYDSLNAARGTSWSTDRLVNSRARVNNYDLGFVYKLNEKHMLSFDAGFFRASDIGFPGVPNDSTPFYFYWPNHDRDNFSVSYSGMGFGGKLAKLDGKFYYEKISKDFSTDFLDAIVIPAGPPPNPPTITPLTSFSSTEVSKIGFNAQGLYQIGSKAMLTFGLDSWREEIDGQVISVTHFEGFGPFPFDQTDTSASVPQNQWYALGLYANGNFQMNSLLITLGGRFDNFWLNTDETPGYLDNNDNPLPSDDDSYSSVNGSLGIVYPLSQTLNAVANVGTAYRVPNVVERFYYGSAEGNEVRPNPDIKPERCVTTDFGLKASDKNYSYSLIGFYSSYRDFTQIQMFGTDPTTSQPLWHYDNVEDVSIFGLEAQLLARFNNGVYGGVNFAYQRGNNDADNTPIFVSPIKTSVSVGYREHQDRYFGQVSVHRVEDQNRIPPVSNLDEITTKGYTLVNTSFGTRVWRYVKLSLSVNNVFDEVYSHPFNGRNSDNPVPEAGRNFILNAKVDLNI